MYDALDRLTEDKRYLPDGTTLVADDVYTYNALGALKTNAGVVLDDQRPKLAGGGTADAAVPATLNGQPVTLNASGLVTSMNGTSLRYSENALLREAQDPIPAPLEHYGLDNGMRRFSKQTSTGDAEFYHYEGMDRVAILDANGALKEGYAFDGVDHPLRIKQTATNTTAYYELDLAGNVRHLFASGGTDLGGYRYSAFGKNVQDTTTITQPLRWKGRWFSSAAGGIYDVRARQWSPEMGVFLRIDEFGFHDQKSTLWGWPNENPLRFLDQQGESKSQCEKDEGPKPQPPPNHCDQEKDECYKQCKTDPNNDMLTCLVSGQSKSAIEKCVQSKTVLYDNCITGCDITRRWCN